MDHSLILEELETTIIKKDGQIFEKGGKNTPKNTSLKEESPKLKESHNNLYKAGKKLIISSIKF